MTADMIDRGWLHDFALACRYATLDLGFQTNNCIQSTRIGLDVLQRLGLTARPQPVVVYAFTESAYRLKEQGVPISQWPDDAWSVGVGPMSENEAATGGWSGHLVLILKNPNRIRSLIDLSADQLDRPERGISVGGPVFMDIEGLWTPHDPRFTVTGEAVGKRTIVQYAPIPKAAAGPWEDAPDWSGHKDIHSAMVESIVNVMREKHPEGPSGV